MLDQLSPDYRVNSITDPILKQLKIYNTRDLECNVRCENLRQVIDYVAQNKISEYQTEQGSLEVLFQPISESLTIIGDQTDSLQKNLIQGG